MLPSDSTPNKRAIIVFTEGNDLGREPSRRVQGDMGVVKTW